MTPEEELDLVKHAIQLAQTVTGCCEWHEQAFRRVSRDAELSSWTPQTIRKLVIEFVRTGGIIRQVKETRPEYNEHEFYHKVIVPVPEFPQGLFVELRLTDPDPDCPTVLLVNAHAQQS